jgi:hypothetical protein
MRFRATLSKFNPQPDATEIFPNDWLLGSVDEEIPFVPGDRPIF